MFAPASRPLQHDISFIARTHKQQRKRRKLEFQDDSRPSSPESDGGQIAPFVPINSGDPYLVAGYTRETALPDPPYPAAPIPFPGLKQNPLDEELFNLKDPVHRLPQRQRVSTNITKRQHLDNLTALLHKCVIRSDWDRAFRILGLMLRTEVSAEPVDLRLHDRWAIAAEVLLRHQSTETQDDHDKKIGRPQDTTRGLNFQAARTYYDRLILQYPHTARTQNIFNATALYPHLFNIWIYEINHKLEQALLTAVLQEGSKTNDNIIDHDYAIDSARVARQEAIGEIRPLNTRLDELLCNPPYNTDAELLRLRSMVTAWLADLQETVD